MIKNKQAQGSCRPPKKLDYCVEAVDKTVCIDYAKVMPQLCHDQSRTQCLRLVTDGAEQLV